MPGGPLPRVPCRWWGRPSRSSPSLLVAATPWLRPTCQGSRSDRVAVALTRRPRPRSWNSEEGEVAPVWYLRQPLCHRLHLGFDLALRCPALPRPQNVASSITGPLYKDDITALLAEALAATRHGLRGRPQAHHQRVLRTKATCGDPADLTAPASWHVTAGQWAKPRLCRAESSDDSVGCSGPILDQPGDRCYDRLHHKV